MRYLSTTEAAHYCGMGGRDPKQRKFLRFVREEGIRFKQGNTETQKLFDKLELDRVLHDNRKQLS